MGREGVYRPIYMNGLARMTFSAVVGGAIVLLLPRAGILAASQEAIAFLALVMAGLLPAMILTATILRAGGMSSRRVREYGGALKAQLRFWGVLFAAAGLATIGIVVAKVFSVTDAAFSWSLATVTISQATVITGALAAAGAGLGVVLQRAYPAYQGLVSLLELNVTMATSDALANDRSYSDALTQEASASEGPDYSRRRA